MTDTVSDIQVDPLQAVQKYVYVGGQNPQMEGCFTPEFIRQWQNLLKLATFTGEVRDLASHTIVPAAGELQGGGPLSEVEILIGLADTAVTPSTYGDSTHVAQFTVDQKGRITAAGNVAIAASSSTAWRIAASWVAASGPVANVVAALNAGESEALVLFQGVQVSGAGVRGMQLSVNAGVSFFTAAGDYLDCSASGATTGQTMFRAATTTTAATSLQAYASVTGLNTTNPYKQGGSPVAATLFVASPNPVNAVRATTSTGVNFTTGAIYILTR